MIVCRMCFSESELLRFIIFKYLRTRKGIGYTNLPGNSDGDDEPPSSKDENDERRALHPFTEEPMPKCNSGTCRQMSVVRLSPIFGISSLPSDLPLWRISCLRTSRIEESKDQLRRSFGPSMHAFPLKPLAFRVRYRRISLISSSISPTVTLPSTSCVEERLFRIDPKSCRIYNRRRKRNFLYDQQPRLRPDGD